MKVYAIFEITNCFADIPGIKESLACECERLGDVKLVDVREAEGPVQLEIGDNGGKSVLQNKGVGVEYV